jgi:type II secretory pathway predicted ATPase ExeA
MFKSFYNFTAMPFARDISTDRLFHTQRLKENVTRLMYAAERSLFAILTGAPGCGKTTTLRLFADNLNAKTYRALYVSDSKLTPRNFYQVLLNQLGCEARFYRGDAKRQLHREVKILQAIHQQKPVVIVDEAHLLDREMLEELRFLLNTEMDSVSPVALVLAGQSELADKLGLQANAAIRQRIDILCQAPHYDRSETGAYIRHHTQGAGAPGEIFSEAAIDSIHSFSGGTARVINKICTQCLIYGGQNSHAIIDDHMVGRIEEGELA